MVGKVKFLHLKYPTNSK